MKESMNDLNIESWIESKVLAQVDQRVESLVDKIKMELKSGLLNDIYLTRNELKEYLKFKSISSVDNCVVKGLKKYKLGKKTLFLRSEVDAWVQTIN